MKFVLFLITVYKLINLSYSYCYWNDPCHYKYFSSKTPYEFVRGDIRDSIKKIEGCESVSVWGLIRHGKRNPGEDFVTKMLDATAIKDYIKTSYDNGKGLMCVQDVENLSHWTIDQEMFKKVHHLHSEGYQEIIGIGFRIRQAFKALFTKLDDSNYILRSAKGHWVENCAKAFIKGFGNLSMIIERSNSYYDIMAPYEACSFYMDKVKKNPKIYAEQNKYQNMTEYLVMKSGIEKRSGINFTLTNENVTSLYDLCRYTSSGINNTMSPWCALFTEKDLQILEYIGDLRHYYRNGYGTNINQYFGRITMADLMESFKNAKNGRGKKLTMYFTHATMMDMVYTSLGLFKDEVSLTATFRNPERKWRASINSAFSSNLVASLNRCTVEKQVEYNVVFYLNERPLKELCNDGVCSWQDFEDKLQPFVNTTLHFC